MKIEKENFKTKQFYVKKEGLNQKTVLSAQKVEVALIGVFIIVFGGDLVLILSRFCTKKQKRNDEKEPLLETQ